MYDRESTNDTSTMKFTLFRIRDTVSLFVSFGKISQPWFSSFFLFFNFVFIVFVNHWQLFLKNNRLEWFSSQDYNWCADTNPSFLRHTIIAMFLYLSISMKRINTPWDPASRVFYPLWRKINEFLPSSFFFCCFFSFFFSFSFRSR